MKHARTTAREIAWDALVNPPDDARPRVWWHWMDGNIDPLGLERDLRWLHSVGVRGVQIFDGGMGVPVVVPEPVRPGAHAWDEAVGIAVTTAAELGLEVAVATSAGWSAAGGPWVAPCDSMKKVVWAEAVVNGDAFVDIALPPLPDAQGDYQDAPLWGSSGEPRWSTTWRVLALPADDAHEPLRPARTTAGPVLVGAADDACATATLTDGAFASGIELPRDPDGWSTAWMEHEFDGPVTVRSITVGLPGPQGFGAAPPAHAVLECSDDGVTYRTVAELRASAVPARTASFPPVAARRFRLVLSGGSAADALPPLDRGVRLPPVLRRSDRFLVTQFVLRAAGGIERAETKAGFGVERDYYAVDTEPASEFGAIPAASVIDVTDRVIDGVLHWDAPPGTWRILHLGASSTGHTNGPAPHDATGLEVDKYDGDRVRTYLERYLQRFDGAPSGIRALLSDSIEAGPQNWTDRIAEHFTRLRGYDPTPWLPALAGFVVESASASDRFLYDYRRTLSDLLSQEYYGTLAEIAHARGWLYYAEALEDGRPRIGDDLAMRARADVPMGAMWTFDPTQGPRPTYVADLKGASSVAHVHGKTAVGAEAFTSFERPWSATPASLKHVADLRLTLGVTRFCLHSSPHQPEAAPPPGIALAPFLGQAFTRHETWANMARPWIDYLARTSSVLSLGQAAVDVAVFVGEEGPVTGLFEHAFDTLIPADLDYDYVSAEGLQQLRVDGDGLHGKAARYRALVLGGSSRRMTAGTLRELRRLRDAGATIIGIPPEQSPSLADDAADWMTLRASLWDEPGRGRVIATDDVPAALASLGIRPALHIAGHGVRRVGRLIDGLRVTFLANPTEDAVRLTITADATALEAWDPVLLSRTPMASCPEGFALELPPFGSAFVVAAADRADPPLASHTIAVRAVAPWTLTFPGSDPLMLGAEPVPWTQLSAFARGFSGIAVYSAHLEGGPAEAQRVLLELGEVHGIASVVVNGVDCGVAWTAPYRVDVSGVWRDGANHVEVHVATPWRNRLIQEAVAPTGEIFAPMTEVFRVDAEPAAAGLGGPISLIRQLASGSPSL